MKKKSAVTIITCLALFCSAQISNAQEKAEPPTLGVQIPGLEYATILAPKGGFIDIPWLAQYISAIAQYLFGISFVAAAVMIVYGGFLLIVGSATPAIKRGKEIIRDALIGLLVLIGSYIILQTVNPETLALKALKVPVVKNIPAEEGDAPAVVQEQKKSVPQGGSVNQGQENPMPSSGSFKFPEAVCRAYETSKGSGQLCKNLCDGCKPIANLPPPPPDMAQPSDLAWSPPNSPGLKSSAWVRKEVVAHLVAAGQAAQNWPGGPYTILLKEGYRPFKNQVIGACQIYCGGEGVVGDNVATPGGSNHGAGVAIDLELWKDKTKLTTAGRKSTQTKDTTKENAKLLQDIMSSVGFVRYCSEVWHFEWGTDSFGKRSKNCPWPPE